MPLAYVAVPLRFRPYVSNGFFSPLSSPCLVGAVVLEIARLPSRLSKLNCSAARIGKFSNVSVNAIYRFVSALTTGANATTFGTYQSLPMHIANWSYGVQSTRVPFSASERLVRLPALPRTVEIVSGFPVLRAMRHL